MTLMATDLRYKLTILTYSLLCLREKYGRLSEALNTTLSRAAMVIFSPVAGLTPWRSATCLMKKRPKSGMEISPSPSTMLSAITPIRALKNLEASVFVMPAFSANAATIYVLFIILTFKKWCAKILKTNELSKQFG